MLADPRPQAGANRLKRKLSGGQLALLAGNFESPEMIDFVGSLGLFDGAWIDMEHGPVAMDSLADMSRAADLWGMSSIVRVRAIDPALIALTMSQGVDGVIVPHVNTRAEAELVVDSVKMAPIGHRGPAGGRRSYGRSLDQQTADANDDSFVAVMIEDVSAVRNLPDILQVPHIDMFFVSHYDLAQSMGLQTDVHNPALIETFDSAVRQVVDAGKVAAAVVGEKDLEKYLALGVRCLKVPRWQALIEKGLRAFAEAVEVAKN